jgi:hypothetical protein
VAFGVGSAPEGGLGVIGVVDASSTCLDGAGTRARSTADAWTLGRRAASAYVFAGPLDGLAAAVEERFAGCGRLAAMPGFGCACGFVAASARFGSVCRAATMASASVGGAEAIGRSGGVGGTDAVSRSGSALGRSATFASASGSGVEDATGGDVVGWRTASPMNDGVAIAASDANAIDTGSARRRTRRVARCDACRGSSRGACTRPLRITAVIAVGGALGAGCITVRARAADRIAGAMRVIGVIGVIGVAIPVATVSRASVQPSARDAARSRVSRRADV